MIFADYLVIALEVWYLVIMGFYMYEGDWKKSLYWFSAILINLSVLMMER